MAMIIQLYPEVSALHRPTNLWRVTCVGKYFWERENQRSYFLTIPLDFLSDFASVPRLLLNILSPSDSGYVESVVLLDYLYASHQLESKADADLAFYETMLTLKTTPWKREVLYYGVKFFGQHSYESGPARWKQRKQFVKTLL